MSQSRLQEFKESIIKNAIKYAPLESSIKILIDLFPRGIAQLFKHMLRPPTSIDDVWPSWLPTSFKSWIAFPEDDGLFYAKEIQKNSKVKTLSIPIEGKSQPLKAYQYTPSFQPQNAKGKCLIYLNGNAQSAGSNFMGYSGDISKLAEEYGFTCISMDYRGKGENKIDGKSWTECSTLDDVHDQQALIKFLIQSGYKPEDITIMGFSLGSQVAIWTAFDFVVQRIAQKLIQERIVRSLDEKHDVSLSDLVMSKASEIEVIRTLQLLSQSSLEFADMLNFYKTNANSFSDDLVRCINDLLEKPSTSQAILEFTENKIKSIASKTEINRSLQDFFIKQCAYEKLNVISWNGFAQLKDFNHVYEKVLKEMFQSYDIDKNLKLDFFTLSLVFRDLDLIPKYFQIEDGAAFLPRCKMFRVKNDQMIPGDGPPDLKEPSLVKTVLQRYPELKKEERAICMSSSNTFDSHCESPPSTYFNEAVPNLTGDKIIASIVTQLPIALHDVDSEEARSFVTIHDERLKRYSGPSEVKSLPTEQKDSSHQFFGRNRKRKIETKIVSGPKREKVF